MQNNSSVGLSQSPPTCGGASLPYSNATQYNVTTKSYPYLTAAASNSQMSGNVHILPIALNSNPAATTTPNYPIRRLYGKACKLPPVQEVGEFCC